jgi:hypothetical protein
MTMMEWIRPAAGEMRRAIPQTARLALVAVLAGCGSDPGEHEYSARFSLTFPAGWERRENYRDMPLVAVASTDDPAEFPANVNVRLVGNPGGVDLDDFYAQHFDEDVARSVHEGFELIDASDRRLGAHAAKRVVYTHRIPPDDLKSIAWLVLAGRRGYIITGNAAVEQFERYERVFDRIAGSFDAE